MNINLSQNTIECDLMHNLSTDATNKRYGKNVFHILP